MELVTRPQFYIDIGEEVEYLASKADPEIATRSHRALDQTIEQVLRQPYIGRARPDLQPSGIRSWRVNHYRRWLIFYALRDDKLLLRVRHGMMDLPALKFES